MSERREPVRYLGTCKRCRGAGRPFVRRMDAMLITRFNDAGTVIGYRVQVPGESRDRFTADGRFLSVECHACIAAGTGVMRAMHYLERVVGHESKHECGAKCLNATGPSCECRCRGQNHGSGYACVAV